MFVFMSWFETQLVLLCGFTQLTQHLYYAEINSVYRAKPENNHYVFYFTSVLTGMWPELMNPSGCDCCVLYIISRSMFSLFMFCLLTLKISKYQLTQVPSLVQVIHQGLMRMSAVYQSSLENWKLFGDKNIKEKEIQSQWWKENYST